MLKDTKLVIRHFSGIKKPCLCLEQGYQSIVIGQLRNEECEQLLSRFLGGGCLFGKMEDIFIDER